MLGTLPPNLQMVANAVPGYRPRTRIIWINPQTDLPEDVAGHPDKAHVDGVSVLRFTSPAVIPPDLYLDLVRGRHDDIGIIIDEVDKARDDVLSSLLTLLSWHERRLRWTEIPQSWYIAAAMNVPRRPLPDPLLARMMFLPYPAPGQDFTTRGELKTLAFAFEGLFDKLVPQFPERPTSPGNAHKFVAWTGDPEFWQDPAYMDLVGRGLWSEKDWMVIKGRLKDRPQFTADAAVEWAKTVNPDNLLTQIPDVLNAVSQGENKAKGIADVLVALVERAEQDKTGELEGILRKYLECPEALAAVGRPHLLAQAKAALGKHDKTQPVPAKKRRGKNDE